MKNKILGWLFKSYAKEQREFYKELSDSYIDAFKTNVDIKDLIRERLKGVRPNHPDDGTILQDHLSGLDNNSRLVFLSKGKELLENEAFQVIVKSLIIESEHDAMLNAVDITQVNFNRATINGVMLIEEEAERLKAMFIEENELNKKMTEEERLSAL